MFDKFNLNRFLQAQTNTYDIALFEIKSGKKTSHWMWYIFPQFKGLGFSSMSMQFSISSIDEGIAFYNHPVLGARLIEISNEFLNLQDKSAMHVIGNTDCLKLKSCMTLFHNIQKENNIFEKILEKYFNGNQCKRTLELIYKN